MSLVFAFAEAWLGILPWSCDFYVAYYKALLMQGGRKVEANGRGVVASTAEKL
jgi:hypothetical protein